MERSDKYKNRRSASHENVYAKISQKLPRVSTGESADKTSTGKAKIGEASKCAESGRTSMSRPPKMPKILGNVVDLVKKNLNQIGAPKHSKKTTKEELQRPIYRQN